MTEGISLVDDALRIINADMAELQAAIRAKGHERGTVSFSISNGVISVALRTGTIERSGEAVFGREPFLKPYVWLDGRTYDEVIAAAQTIVRAMRPAAAVAAAAWFDMAVYQEVA